MTSISEMPPNLHHHCLKNNKKLPLLEVFIYAFSTSKSPKKTLFFVLSNYNLSNQTRRKIMIKNIQLKEPNAFEKLNEYIYLCLGDSIKKLKEIEDCSVDCVITDPPYFIDGMGNNWNEKELNKKVSKAKTIGGLPVGMKFDAKQGIELQKFMEEISKEVFRILRPGGFYLSFSQARLLHRMAIGIENRGFEIRDTLFWKRRSQPKAFSQNHFVKKMNISEDEKEKNHQQYGE